MEKLKLKAEKRKITGRKVKRLRNEGLLPANIFGKKIKSLAIKLPLSEFEKTFKKAGETSLINIDLDKKSHAVLISNVQTNPVSGELLHVDFREVDLKEKVQATIPVDMVGESPADKQGLGVLVQLVDEVEIKALPTDLPEKFEVSVDKLENVDDAVEVSDIKYDKEKIEMINDKNQIIAKIEALQKEEEIAPQPEAEATEGGEVAAEEAPQAESSQEEGSSEEA